MQHNPSLVLEIASKLPAKKKTVDNDATPERLARAREADLDTEYLEFVTLDGKICQRRQILPVLETYSRRKIITRVQRDSGNMFLHLVYRASARTRVTMAYHVGVDNSHARMDMLDFIELRTEASRDARQAALAVYPRVRLALNWLVDSMAEEKRIGTLGAMYAGSQNRDAQTERGLTVLRFALDCLAHHFRLDDLKPTSAETKRWLEFLLRREG